MRKFRGALRLNGQSPGPSYTATAALVHQQDVFFGYLTVRCVLIVLCCGVVWCIDGWMDRSMHALSLLPSPLIPNTYTPTYPPQHVRNLPLPLIRPQHIQIKREHLEYHAAARMGPRRLYRSMAEGQPSAMPMAVVGREEKARAGVGSGDGLAAAGEKGEWETGEALRERQRARVAAVMAEVGLSGAVDTVIGARIDPCVDGWVDACAYVCVIRWVCR